MLRVPRSAVDAYVQRHALAVREDPSNRDPRYLRNRVRRELLPLLERRYRPQLRKRLAALAGRMAAIGPVQTGSDSPPPSTGRPWGALDGWLEGRRWLKMERRSWTGGRVPNGAVVAAFDAELLGTPAIRLVRPGDRIRPFGMQGRRKVRDLLREHGVAVEARPVMPIVVDPEDTVIWVPGIGRSADAPISGTTREVWWFSIGQDHELQAHESRATLQGATVGKSEDYGR